MRRVLIGCGGLLAVIVVLAIIIAAISGGGQDVTQKQEEKEEQKAQPVQKNEPKEEAKKKEQENVQVRISGTQGVEYSGSYGSTQGQRTVDGTLGAAPDVYDVEGNTGSLQLDVITASFQKRSPGPGDLRVEIVTDGDVQASQETSAEFGVVTTSWSPQAPQNK